jgi:hypothetical protein
MIALTHEVVEVYVEGGRVSARMVDDASHAQ